MPGSLLDSNVSPYSRGGVEIPAGGWIWTTAPSPLGGLRSTANPRHRWWGGACGRQGHPGVLSRPSPLDLGRRPQSEAGRAVVTASAQLRLSTSGNRGVRGTAGHQGWRLSPSVAPRVRRSVSGEPTFLMNILEGGSGSPLGLTPLKADGLVRGGRGRGWGGPFTGRRGQEAGGWLRSPRPPQPGHRAAPLTPVCSFTPQPLGFEKQCFRGQSVSTSCSFPGFAGGRGVYPGGEAWRGRDGSTGLLPGSGGPCAGRGVPALGTTTQGAPAPALSDDTGSGARVEGDGCCF